MDLENRVTDFDKIEYILHNHERVLEERRRLKPNGRPFLLFPSGKVRIERFGTFPNINEAYKALKRLDGDTSQETLPASQQKPPVSFCS